MPLVPEVPVGDEIVMWPYDRESATTLFTRGYDNVMFWDGMSFGEPDYWLEKSGRRRVRSGYPTGHRHGVATVRMI